MARPRNVRPRRYKLLDSVLYQPDPTVKPLKTYIVSTLSNEVYECYLIAGVGTKVYPDQLIKGEN